jgi:hypothetical protein
LTRFQIQAVLRRSTRKAPLRLAGIVLDNRFFSRDKGEEDRLTLTKGLVALAPLSAVEALDAEEAAEVALVDASETWDGPNSPAPALATHRQ